jgi:hypothetical protein
MEVMVKKRCGIGSYEYNAVTSIVDDGGGSVKAQCSMLNTQQCTMLLFFADGHSKKIEIPFPLVKFVQD